MQRTQVYGLSELPIDAVRKHSEELHLFKTDARLAEMHRGSASFDMPMLELKDELIRIADTVDSWEKIALRRIKANIDRGEWTSYDV